MCVKAEGLKKELQAKNAGYFTNTSAIPLGVLTPKEEKCVCFKPHSGFSICEVGPGKRIMNMNITFKNSLLRSKFRFAVQKESIHVLNLTPHSFSSSTLSIPPLSIPSFHPLLSQTLLSVAKTPFHIIGSGQNLRISPTQQHSLTSPNRHEPSIQGIPQC